MNCAQRSFFLAAAVAVLCGGLMASTSHAALHDGLVSYWPLSEGSGTVAGDAAPGGTVADNGELRNSPTWIDGKFNAGLQFTGADANQQYVLIPNSADMDIGTSAVTVSAWVKLDTLPSGIAENFAGIVDSAGASDAYNLYLDKNANELRFKVTDNAGVSTSAHPGVPASLLDTTNWHHVAGVFDGSAGSVKIYFNGNLVDVASMPTTVGLVRTGQITGLGAAPAIAAPHDPSLFFEGGVSDVAVWNRPLDGAEIQHLYNGGTGNAVGSSNPSVAPLTLNPTAPAAQPVVYYPFNGDLKNYGTGGSALDAVLHDDPSRNINLFTETGKGQGLDLRDNPDTPSTVDNGDYLSVNYTLPEQGTIELEFTADKFYDHQTLWSNSGHGNAWESWIYANGRLAARANNGSNASNLDYFLPLTGGLDTTHHIAFTWERNGDQMETRLYVDGDLKEIATENWLAPGSTVFLGGGIGDVGGANDLGSGVYDEFRIYDVVLSDSEILFRSQVPEPTSALMAGIAAVLGCFVTSRRVARSARC